MLFNRKTGRSEKGGNRQCKLWASGSDTEYLNNKKQLQNTCIYVQNNHIKHNVTPLKYTTFEQIPLGVCER